MPLKLAQQTAIVVDGRLRLAPPSDKPIRAADPVSVVYALPVSSGAWEIGFGTLLTERTGKTDSKGKPLQAVWLDRDVILASSNEGLKIEAEALDNPQMVVAAEAGTISGPDAVKDVAEQLGFTLPASESEGGGLADSIATEHTDGVDETE